MKKTLAAAALILALTACGTTSNPPPTRTPGTVSLDDVTGEIVDKDHDAAKYRETRKCVRKHTSGTKKGTCASYRTEKTLVEPENWDITVRDAAGTEHEIDVPNYVYEAVEVGDTWPAS